MISPSFDILSDITPSLLKQARASYWISKSTTIINKKLLTKKPLRLLHSRDRSYGVPGFRPRILIGTQTLFGTTVFLFFQDNTVLVGTVQNAERPLNQNTETPTLAAWVFGLTQDVRTTPDSANKRTEIFIEKEKLTISPYGFASPTTPSQENWLAALFAEGEAIVKRMAATAITEKRMLPWLPVTPSINETLIKKTWAQTFVGSDIPIDDGILTFESFMPGPKYQRLQKIIFTQNQDSHLLETHEAHQFSQALWPYPDHRGQDWHSTKSGYKMRGKKITITLPPLSAHEKIALLKV